MDSQERTYYHGYKELAEREVLASIIGCGGFVIDVGANIGLITVLAADCVGERGRVLAFEPNPVIQKRLVGHVENLKQVSVHGIALGARPGEAVLSVPRHHAGGATLLTSTEADESDSITVPVRTLDEVLGSVDQDVDLLKVDVEGFEGEVLRGAERLLRSGRLRHLFVEYTPRWGSNAWMSELVDMLGDDYEGREITFRRKMAILRRPKLVPFSWEDFAGEQCNVLFSHRGHESALQSFAA